MPPSETQKMETARRRNQVIRLREAGATWEEIANVMLDRHGEERLPSGWDRRYAYKDFYRELEKLNNEMERNLEKIRQVELRRLNRMMRGIWQEAIGSDDATWQQQKDAIDRVLRIMKRRSDLIGLDAPEEYSISHDEVDWDEFTDEELMRIAEGESVESVLNDRS